MDLYLVGYMLFFTCLVSWLFFYTSNKYWGLKFLTLGFAFFICSAIMFSFESYKGWPTDGLKYAIDQSLVLNIMVNDKGPSNEGSIFVTALPCFSKNACSPTWKDKVLLKYFPEDYNTPRVYEFPYNDKTRKAFGLAREAMEEGRSVFLDVSSLKGKKGKGTGKEGDETDKDQAGREGGLDTTLNAWADDTQEININIVDQSKGILKKDY